MVNTHFRKEASAVYTLMGAAVGLWDVVRPLLTLYFVWRAVRALEGLAAHARNRVPGGPSDGPQGA